MREYTRELLSCSTTALPNGARPQRAKLDLARDLNLTKGQVRDVPVRNPSRGPQGA